jgi:serine/threonine-protein kinase
MSDSTPDWGLTMETTFVAPVSDQGNVAVLPGKRPSDSLPKDYDAAVLADISSHLANYIGPIARIIVKRASGSSNNLRELCDKVAQEIDSENHRKQFLQNIRRHFRAASGL